MSQIEFKKVSYINKGLDILKDITIKINQGDYISVVGPSGSGKSTFLKLCCHLISPSQGTIFINGTDIMSKNPIEIRKKISYCFQTPVLFGNTVEDNLKYPYLIRNQKMDKDRIITLLSRFNMDETYIKHEVKNLSGGEKQRIALIRTLLFKPKVLLLDEVTSALDVDNTLIVENAINDLHKEGVAILWVTHNPEQSKKYADKLLTIENGQIKSLEAIR